MTEKVEAETTAAPAAEPVKTEPNPLEKTLNFTVSSEQLGKGVEARLKKIARKAKMPGFRPGRVPMDMIRATYGQQAYFDEMNELVGQAYVKAVTEAKLPVVGEPRITAGEAKEGEKDLPFTAVVEVYPEIAEPSLEGVEIKKAVYSVTDADVEETIRIMVRQRASYETEEGRKAQKDDSVTINFKGTKDGVAFEGGSAEGFVFVIGQGRMLPDFEKGVEGLAAGEKSTFDLTFPENYGAKNLAGQKVQFEVEVVKVDKPVYPEVDEKFAKGLGLDGVEALRREVRSNLDREVAARLRQRNTVAVMDALDKLATFPIPTALVDRECREMAQNAAADLKARGMKQSSIELPPELFKESALRRVRLGMLVSKLVEDHKLQATAEQTDKLIETQSSAYEKPEEMASYLRSNPQYMANLANIATEDNVVAYVLGQVKAEEEALTFDQLMKGFAM